MIIDLIKNKLQLLKEYLIKCNVIKKYKYIRNCWKLELILEHTCIIKHYCITIYNITLKNLVI